MKFADYEVPGWVAPIAVAVAFLGWWLAVVGSALGIGVQANWDFSTTGQLGDSFGILSALMASLAALFTFQTLRDAQRDRAEALEKAELAKREAERDREEFEEREARRHAAEQRRDAEGTFFRLMELRVRLLGDLRVKLGQDYKIGTDAVEEIVRRINPGAYDEPNNFDYQKSYSRVFSDFENDLGHYFRFTYHTIRFAKERFSVSAYQYVRLLRAQLSSSETSLIALNCCFGEGRGKFSDLVEHYSLLHNISRHDRKVYNLDEFFSPRAFDPDVTLASSRAYLKERGIGSRR
jgi:hypothetical protein